MVRIFAALAALALSAVLAAAEEAPRLTVTGFGSVAAAPDMARISLGVTETAKTARAAMEEASLGMATILAVLATAGIEDRDLQTGEISLSPIWSDDDGEGVRRITGFQAVNSLNVRVRDLDRLGTVLDAVLEAGANSFRGLSFGLQDPVPVADEARRRAVADALRKARLMAEAAGLGLGGILSIDEGAGARPQVMEMSVARGAGMPMAAGEVTTEATVSMVFALTGGG